MKDLAERGGSRGGGVVVEFDAGDPDPEGENGFRSMHWTKIPSNL